MAAAEQSLTDTSTMEWPDVPDDDKGTGQWLRSVLITAWARTPDREDDYAAIPAVLDQIPRRATRRALAYLLRAFIVQTRSAEHRQHVHDFVRTANNSRSQTVTEDDSCLSGRPHPGTRRGAPQYADRVMAALATTGGHSAEWLALMNSRICIGPKKSIPFGDAGEPELRKAMMVRESQARAELEWAKRYAKTIEKLHHRGVDRVCELPECDVLDAMRLQDSTGGAQ